jgi:hypothetical protein
MTVLDYGMIYGGGIGDYSEPINYRDTPDKYLVKLAHDSSFLILVKFILLNILFGIIIDTFAQLREEKKFIEDDMMNICFICNFDRLTFDRNSEGGFERHIAKDHNLWCYVYYIVHLNFKDPTNYTGIESYVSELYLKGEATWVPRQKALCLENIGNSDDEGDKEVNLLRSEIS